MNVVLRNKNRVRIGAQAFESKGIYESVDKITQKIAVHLPLDQTVFMIQISDLKHIFGCDLEQNQTRL